MKRKIFIYSFFALLFVAILIVGQAEIFIAAYVVAFILVVIRTLMTPGRRKTRRHLVLAYSSILIVQLIMVNNVIFVEAMETDIVDIPDFVFRRILGIALLCLPALVNRFVASVKYTHYYLPPVGESAAVGISELLNTGALIKNVAGFISESKTKVSIESMTYMLKDLSRHDSFHYVNSRSLTEEYFIKARESFSDPNIYIVISKTGSPHSEFLSIFTQKQYNHASISFDKKLQTTISYNGGERVYPPGLNMELLDFFCKAPDSKIMVYSLPCSADKKKQILDKIEKINREGSAYNMLGVFIHKKPPKPNILYCSQFVYNMLEDVGLTYFEAANRNKISPTDLVENDYYRKLKFELEITFG
jgi:hypothetical protein